MKGATTNRACSSPLADVAIADFIAVAMQLRFFMFGHDVETYAKEALSALWPTAVE